MESEREKIARETAVAYVNSHFDFSEKPWLWAVTVEEQTRSIYVFMLNMIREQSNATK